MKKHLRTTFKKLAYIAGALLIMNAAVSCGDDDDDNNNGSNPTTVTPEITVNSLEVEEGNTDNDPGKRGYRPVKVVLRHELFSHIAV